MAGAVLVTPPHLLGEGQVSEVVDSHRFPGAGPVVDEGGGGQGPGSVRGLVVEDGAGAAAPLPGLGHALDGADGAAGDVVDAQKVGDGAGGPAGFGSFGWWGGECGEGAVVDQAAGVQGEVAAQRGQLWGEGCGCAACGAQGGVRDAAPRGAVVGGVGDAGADVPAADGRDSGCGEFLRVEPHGSAVAVCAGMPVDAAAAVWAAAGLRGAGEAGGAAGVDAQGP